MTGDIPEPAPARPAPERGVEGKDPLRSSRASGTWLAVVGLCLVLLLLVVFIAQNTQTAEVHFLGWEGEAPQAVTLLVAALAGLLLAVTAASLRILQLRRRVRRTR
ncbi:lipopolysaccharide assembly protein LapA domain-containing protein [Nocardioides sp. SYSU D00038]|uniref:lipopolysaccharide assembly protein LapA domain-containing protein n=1 Tax=Nocardioides sp. SYSU D00038 TaxID=2812554 RepID=UPI001967795F|nr:lipopolysaccharide assembly protein LapA domain-containing protein [Nocardioides sp. SYSU D00038]